MAAPAMAAAARTERGVRALAALGIRIYGLAMVGLGADLAYAAHRPAGAALPVLPFPPPVPTLAYAMAAVLAAAGAGLFVRTTRAGCARVLALFLLLSALILELPRYAAVPGSMAVRTGLFEPLALAALAALLLPRPSLPARLERASRWVLALALIVFGVDHFLGLAAIAALIPAWIPWHVFWTAFFGAVFIAGGIGIGAKLWLRWSALGLGLMFALWVLTLHLPLAMGWESLPGRNNGASLWSSLFIALALWGGAWALAGREDHPDAGV